MTAFEGRDTVKKGESCAAENLLLVKNELEEVGFKARLEGMEGRAVMESERKRFPDLCSREAEGVTTMLFSFEGGDAKSSLIRRRTQKPRRDKDLDRFSQVLMGSAVLSLRTTHCVLVVSMRL